MTSRSSRAGQAEKPASRRSRTASPIFFSINFAPTSRRPADRPSHPYRTAYPQCCGPACAPTGSWRHAPGRSRRRRWRIRLRRNSTSIRVLGTAFRRYSEMVNGPCAAICPTRRSNARRARTASPARAISAPSSAGWAATARSTRPSATAPCALSPASAANGKDRAAGSQTARNTANRKPRSAATSATAPLSISTAAQPVCFQSACFANRSTMIRSPPSNR